MKADPTWHSPDGDGCECLVRDGGDPSKPWELHVADDNQIRVFSVDRATFERMAMGSWYCADSSNCPPIPRLDDSVED